MRLGIISDTHDRLSAADRALEYLAELRIDMLVHCGDWKSLSTLNFISQKVQSLNVPLRGVLGNNDADMAGFLQLARTLPGDIEIIEGILRLGCDGKLAAVYHGHHKPTLRKLMADESWDILLLGHTHKPYIEQSGRKLIVNPGSTAFAIPRRTGWQPSVAVVDTDTMKAEIAFVSI